VKLFSEHHLTSNKKILQIVYRSKD